MTKATKLTRSDIHLITHAAGRRNGDLLPLPEGTALDDPQVGKRLKRLLTGGLIEERPTKSAAASWRTDDDGQHYSLRLTEAGRLAATPPAPSATAGDGCEGSVEAPDRGAATAKPSRGKLGQVITAVTAPGGASLDELVALTGWLPHTVRACITRLRQAGTLICLAATETGRRYVAEASSSAVEP